MLNESTRQTVLSSENASPSAPVQHNRSLDIQPDVRVPTHPVLHGHTGGSSGDQRFQVFEVKHQLLKLRLLPGGGILAPR